MSIKPCLVIPVYNHARAIGQTVAGLRAYRLPIYLVDDGSDLVTQQRLAEIAANEADIHLLRLPKNAGKGAAVMQGLRQALAAGFTHALQIDADGQHDTRDVPRFIAAAESSPDAVVCGQPIFDASIPKSRLYGRYLTHFFVWIETLSFSIKDSMCGFRMYPLARTCRVIAAGRVPKRMDFDTAIAVRLVWTGVPVINVPTRVTYPRDGVSHFDMLRDNVRITRTHALLVVGMLGRLPLLLWRKWYGSVRPEATHWARLAERGSYVGLLIVLFFYRLLGRRATRALLYPVVGYFFGASRRARRASAKYLQRLYAYTQAASGLSQPPTWRDSWRHLYAFADSGLDKIAAWSGDVDPAQVEFPHRAELDALIASGRGAVLLGAHLGNWEMSRALAHFGGYRAINAVVYTEHARKFTRLLARTNDSFSVNLIPVSTIGPETAVVLQEKIDRGELLVIVGDRTPPRDNGRVTRVPFLGHDAPFAQGPFILAALLACPVYLFFCLREGACYRIHLEHFADRIELPRRRRDEALHEYARRYAERLGSYCIRAPHQWFNFYDFWDDAETHQHVAPSPPSELDHAKPRRA